MKPRPALALAALAAAVAVSGCRVVAESSADQQRLIFAQVIDEVEFPAQAGQVEELALRNCRQPRAAAGAVQVPPTMAELLNSPAKCRGRRVAFRGKLVAITKPPPAKTVAKENIPPMPTGIGRQETGDDLVKGLVLLPDGGLAAFRAPLVGAGKEPPALPPVGAAVEVSGAFRAPLVGAGQEPPALPPVGAAVEVSGAFLKRWMALEGAGTRYVVMPLLAGALPVALAGEEAKKLAALEPARGLLPVTELEAPPVWSRPVVELGKAGALRLDGRAVTQEALGAEFRQLAAAAGKTPLGESALVAVVLVAPDAPAEALEALKKALPVKAVWRIAP